LHSEILAEEIEKLNKALVGKYERMRRYNNFFLNHREHALNSILKKNNMDKSELENLDLIEYYLDQIKKYKYVPKTTKEQI